MSEHVFGVRYCKNIGLVLLFLFTIIGGVVRADYLAADVGGYLPNFRDFLNTSTTNRLETTSPAGFGRLRYGFNLSRKIRLEPSLGFVFPWRAGADGSAKTFTFHFGAPVSFPIFSFLRFHIGPGLRMNWIHTSAESLTLNNGGGTATFYLPDRNVLSFAVTALTGFQIILSKKVSINLETHVLGLLSSSRRNFELLASVGINLYGKNSKY